MNTNTNKIYLIVVLLFVFLLGGGLLYQFGLIGKATLITVTGEGKVKAVPTVVKFTVTTMNTAPSATQAINTNNGITKSLVNVLRNKGVNESEILTALPVVSPPQATFGQTNYQAANAIIVTMHDVNQLEGAISQLYGNGAISVGNIIFSTDNSTELEKQAVSLAISNTKERAKELAKASGKRLGRMVSIATSEVGDVGEVVGNGEALNTSSSIPGQIEVARQASIVYELR